MRTIFGNFIMFGAFVDGWHSDEPVFSYKEKVPSGKKIIELIGLLREVYCR